MPNIRESKSRVKAPFLQAASLGGLEVSAKSPERLVQLVENGFAKVKPERLPEAVANPLKVIAETLIVGQETHAIYRCHHFHDCFFQRLRACCFDIVRSEICSFGSVASFLFMRYVGCSPSTGHVARANKKG